MSRPFLSKLNLRSLFLLCFFAAISHLSWAQQAATIDWTPGSLANGSPCFFNVLAPGAVTVSGLWQNRKLVFFKTPSGNVWSVLAGVDIETQPGTYPIDVELTFPDGKVQKLQRMVSIEEAPYQSTTLSVPDKFVEPDAASLKLIASEKIIKDKAFAGTAPLPLWSGSFSPPLHTAPRTDSFGTRRIFNGSLASIHRGLDYHAKIGTPVAASNAGRVIIARPLYYEGNCVIIDHGQGFITLYMHLSHFRIKEGGRVKKGQIIGLSGRTGRTTGPHLHLGVRWQGAYLDPAKLFTLDLPRLAHP
jgi:hypothetical protein